MDPVRSFFNTDKIWMHDYFPVYMKIALELGPSARACEIGVQNGESLRMWQSLFPTGQVTGVDCDAGAVFPAGARRVIKYQHDPELASLGSFDLIVDDASHNGKLTRRTFDILWENVTPGGYYVIEDWFIGLEKYTDDAYDPSMLETARSFIEILTKNSGCESVTYRYGLIILRKAACA
jgi:hypothetical protein